MSISLVQVMPVDNACAFSMFPYPVLKQFPLYNFIILVETLQYGSPDVFVVKLDFYEVGRWPFRHEPTVPLCRSREAGTERWMSWAVLWQIDLRRTMDIAVRDPLEVYMAEDREIAEICCFSRLHKL